MPRHCVGWGLSGSWEHGQRGNQSLSQCQEQGSRGDTGERASLGLWVELMAGHGRAVRNWRLGSLGTGKWHQGAGMASLAVGGFGGAPRGIKCLYCPKTPNASYFMDWTARQLRNHSFLQCHLNSIQLDKQYRGENGSLLFKNGKKKKKTHAGKDKVGFLFLSHSISHKESFIFRLKIEFLKQCAFCASNLCTVKLQKREVLYAEISFKLTETMWILESGECTA